MSAIMPEAPAEQRNPLDERIAQRVRQLRAAAGLSLEALAVRSGVSRSMLSLIERGESSATAVVLDKVATGLGVVLASLFDDPAAPASPVSRRAEQALWRDPSSGYLRRNVSPPGLASPIQLVEVEFPPGARVAYDSGPREPRVHQQIWVLEGAIEVTVGEDVHLLKAGDCLAHVLDRPVAYRNPARNPTGKPARYAVVIATGRRS
jgi:transcriptional regulator with XRE-family HTH domain